MAGKREAPRSGDNRGAHSNATTTDGQPNEVSQKSKQRFKSRFKGFSKGYGQFRITGKSGNGKTEGSAVTKRSPPLDSVWDAHFHGLGTGIGIVPLCDDDTVVWGCIDIDVNTIDHNALERQIDDIGLPGIVARSKSGGAHIFLFTSEPVPASVMQDKLGSAAAALGYGNAEIFPKQTNRADKDDVGNWLNLPYYKAIWSTRYAIRSGEALSMDGFLDYADEREIDVEQLSQLNFQPKVSSSFPEGPPCLQILEEKGGFPEGTRNNGMYDVAVYLKKRYPDDWQDHLQTYNVQMCDPPLSLQEVQAISKSVAKKDYEYKCKEQPICSYCNHTECKTREFGVGGAGDGSGIEHLQKYETDPVHWYAQIDGQRILLTTDQLLDQNKFKRKVADKLNFVPTSVPAKRWDKYVSGIMETCEVIDLDGEGTEYAQLMEALVFVSNVRAQAKKLEELETRAVAYVDWYKDGGGKVCFRLPILRQALESNGIKFDNEGRLAALLKNAGAVPDLKKIKGRQMRYWWIELPYEMIGSGHPDHVKEEPVEITKQEEF